jgi:hypothetical protein
METTPKIFLEIGAHLINMNAIAFVVQLPDGSLRITTMATSKSGSPYTFIVPKGNHAAEFRRQIAPHIAVYAPDVPAEPGDVD